MAGLNVGLGAFFLARGGGAPEAADAEPESPPQPEPAAAPSGTFGFVLICVVLSQRRPTLHWTLRRTLQAGELPLRRGFDLAEIDAGRLRAPGSMGGVTAVGVESCWIVTVEFSGSGPEFTIGGDRLPATPPEPGIFTAGPTPAQIPFFNRTLCIDPVGLRRFDKVTSPDAAGITLEAVLLATSAAVVYTSWPT